MRVSGAKFRQLHLHILVVSRLSCSALSALSQSVRYIFFPSSRRVFFFPPPPFSWVSLSPLGRFFSLLLLSLQQLLPDCRRDPPSSFQVRENFLQGGRPTALLQPAQPDPPPLFFLSFLTVLHYLYLPFSILLSQLHRFFQPPLRRSRIGVNLAERKFRGRNFLLSCLGSDSDSNILREHLPPLPLGYCQLQF